VKTKHFLAAALATTTLALTACGKDTQAGREINRISEEIDREAMKGQIRQGPYWTACQDSAVVGNPFQLPKVRSEVDYGASLQRTTTFFGAGDCNTTPAITIIENGNYEIGSRAANDVYELNESYLSVAITPVTDEGKQALIASNACGTTDWTVGVQKVVTGDTATPGCWTQTPREVFDIVQKYNSGVQYGQATQDKDKTATDRRPTQLDPALRFDKK
jgi:hypothetical protein